MEQYDHPRQHEHCIDLHGECRDPGPLDSPGLPDAGTGWESAP